MNPYTRPDGSVPLVGDSDDGRLFRISMKQEVNDHRHALSVGAILFRRADFSQRAGRFDQEALWYFGGEGFEVYRTLQSPRTAPHSSAFPRGGFYIMQRDLAHLFADVGDIGARGIGSHGHNDTLSFELWYKSPIIVDSGTHNYTKNSASRKLLQGTGAHNTLVVDDREIAEWAGLWELKEDLTDPGVINWEMSEEKDFLDAEHKGYARLSDPVLHRRKWKFDKQGNEVLVTDVVTGHRAHSLQFRFHFHPSVVLKQEGTRSYRARNGEGTILLSCSEDVNIIDTSFSPSYGVLLPSKGLQVRLDVKLPYTLTTRITLL